MCGVSVAYGRIISAAQYDGCPLVRKAANRSSSSRIFAFCASKWTNPMEGLILSAESTISILVLLAVAVLGPAMATARELTEHEKEIIANGVKRSLKDPDSARFKWVPYVLSSTEKAVAENQLEKGSHSKIRYCALVNARNGFGGYAGSEPFVAILEWEDGNGLEKGRLVAVPAAIVGGDTNSPDVWKLCELSGYPKEKLIRAK